MASSGIVTRLFVVAGIAIALHQRPRRRCVQRQDVLQKPWLAGLLLPPPCQHLSVAKLNQSLIL